MSLGVRRPLGSIGNSTIAVVFVAMIASVPAAFAQLMPAGHQQQALSDMESTQKVVLFQEITKLRSRIAQIQATLNQNHQGAARRAGTQSLGMALDDETGMSGAASKPSLDNKNMPTPADCCAGMMGKMGAAGTLPTEPSDLPGFPGVLHIYHVGATGFFLDYSAAIKLTTMQQVALTGIKERSIRDLAAGKRKIDQAEQELWILTGSDRPDAMKIEAKVRDIERLKGDERISFIRSVGEAARVLTDDQRAALLGMSPPQSAQLPPQQAPADSVNPQGGVGSMAPKSGMSDDSMDTTGGGSSLNPESDDDGMEDM